MYMMDLARMSSLSTGACVFVSVLSLSASQSKANVGDIGTSQMGQEIHTGRRHLSASNFRGSQFDLSKACSTICKLMTRLAVMA